MAHPNPLPETSPLFGHYIGFPDPGPLERIGSDWDWIWIDGQHGQIGYADILALVRMCDLIRRPALVRVASHEYGEIGRALDTGAAGLIVPCVDTPEQAAQVVFAAKFPPVGGRSFGSARIGARQGRTYVGRANEEVKLFVQIETPLAITHVERIASVPGVDGLFFGPDDLTLRRGITVDAPRTIAMLGPDMEAVASACRRHGKKAATASSNPELAAYAARSGYHLIAAGSEVGFLAAGSAKASADIRATTAPK